MRIIDTTVGGLTLLSLLTIVGCTSGARGKNVQASSASPEHRTVEARSHPADSAPQSAKVVVSYSLKQDHITLHEPAFLNFTVANGTSGPIVVDLGANLKEIFSFTIAKPDGSRIDLPRKMPEGSALIGRVTLRSEETYAKQLLLNEWFGFDTPGQYEISVRLVKPQFPARGIDIYDIYDTPEFRTTLYIQPRDPTRLNELCANLETQIINARPGDAMEPAEALSYVEDPVAVPYLEAALNSGKMVEGSAIMGLERIGGDEAIRILTAESKNRNDQIARFARSALERLKTKSKSN